MTDRESRERATVKSLNGRPLDHLQFEVRVLWRAEGYAMIRRIDGVHAPFCLLESDLQPDSTTEAPPTRDALDAARYRWLRDHAGSVFSTTPDGWRLAVVARAPGHGIIPRGDDLELDAAIDAAMSAQGDPDMGATGEQA